MVHDTVFEWESAPEGDGGAAKADDAAAGDARTKPFQVRLDDMRVKRGSLVAVVGPVGSGKVLFASHTTENNLLIGLNS